MTKLAPEWVRTSDPVIRSPARYRWTTAPAHGDKENYKDLNLNYKDLNLKKFDLRVELEPTTS